MGDGGTGKTCLCLSFAEDRFYGEYVPTVFDNYAVTMLAEEKDNTGKSCKTKATPVNLGLWDTAGQEEYDRLRPLSYPGTDAFVVVFSLTSQTSLNNVKSRWLPELKRFNPDTPFVLVGTKKDLVDMSSNGEAAGASISISLVEKQLQERSLAPIANREEARKLADDSGAIAFVECSAMTQENVQDVFQTVVNTVLTARNSIRAKPARRRARGCSIM
jgi:small GTP-binding protein